MLLSGDTIDEVNERGETAVGDSLLVLLNAHGDKVPFTLPGLDADQQWQRVLDTSDAGASERAFKSGGRYPLQGQSLAVFKVTPPLHERRRAAKADRAAQPQPEPAVPETAEPVGVDS
jgi:pullulanase/glycogen debranching enzyme